MAKQVAYFDSQASAAATLNVDIEMLREAKARGCPAFRSGRVYREELLRWLKEHPIVTNKPEAFSLDEPEFLGVQLDWENRRDLLFILGDFLDCLFADGVLGGEEYRRLGDKTIPLIIELGRVWNAGIDEAGYLYRWLQCRKQEMGERAPSGK